MFQQKIRRGGRRSEPDLGERIDFKKPFILSMGPQRCATSWLDRYLRARGDVCLPSKIKEIQYFDRHYARGAFFYKRHFRPAANHSAIIEVSTTCFDAPEAPKRVYEALGPDIKLLCPLRHPVSRSYSLYKHYMRYGQVKGTLRQACQLIPQILTSSYYAKHVQAWLEYFPLESIKFVFQEDQEADQDAYIHDICAYLGVQYVPLQQNMRQRCNTTEHVRYSILASGAQFSAELLRKYELYDLINVAKALGLKGLVFGKDTGKAAETGFPAADRAWLEEQLLIEVEKLEALLGPIPQW